MHVEHAFPPVANMLPHMWPHVILPSFRLRTPSFADVSECLTHTLRTSHLCLLPSRRARSFARLAENHVSHNPMPVSSDKHEVIASTPCIFAGGKDIGNECNRVTHDMRNRTHMYPLLHVS